MYFLIVYLLFLFIAFLIGCFYVCSKEKAENKEKMPLLSTADNKTKERDDLKKIKGIGVKLESLLNSLGIYTYEQIANWNKEDIKKVDSYLKFPGRIERDGWVRQAKELYENKIKRQ